MGWCDDSKSKKYNQEISFPFKYSAEKLYRKDKNYDIFLNIKYNYLKPKKDRGSAIFLHLCSKKYKPTDGCIAIVKKDFLKVIKHINNYIYYKLHFAFCILHFAFCILQLCSNNNWYIVIRLF